MGIQTDKGYFTACKMDKNWSWDKSNPTFLNWSGKSKRFEYSECYIDDTKWRKFDIVTLLSEVEEDCAKGIVDDSVNGFYKDYCSGAYTMESAISSLRSMLTSKEFNIVRNDYLILRQIN